MSVLMEAWLRVVLRFFHADCIRDFLLIGGVGGNMGLVGGQNRLEKVGHRMKHSSFLVSSIFD